MCREDSVGSRSMPTPRSVIAPGHGPLIGEGNGTLLENPMDGGAW